MKYYRAHLSNKQSIILDDIDYEKLLAGMNSGSFVKLKKAIINPSFLMMILPVSQSEALQEEIAPRKIEGYIDENTGVYVVTKDNTPLVVEIKDEFNQSSR